MGLIMISNSLSISYLYLISVYQKAWKKPGLRLVNYFLLSAAYGYAEKRGYPDRRY